MPLPQRSNERRTVWSLPERQSSHYFHNLIEASLDPLVTISPAGEIADFNTATEQVTGVARDSLVGSDFAGYFTDPAKARECYQLVFEQGFVKNFPLAIRHTSGKITDVLYNARIYHDDTGVVLGVFAAARDITELKQMEEALLESERRANFGLTITHTGAWDLDLATHKSCRTLEHDRIFGYRELLPEWTYELFLAHVLPEDRAEVDRMFNEADARRGSLNFQCRIRRVDGHTRWVWVFGQQQLTDDAEPARRMIGIIQDITAQKQSEEAEEALQESERRYRAIADYNPNWEYWILPDGSLRYVSPLSEQVSGYTPEEFYADPGLLTRIIHPEDRALYAGHEHHISDSGVRRPIYFRIQTKDGDWRWIAHVCRPVYGPDGNPTGFRGSNRDDTERRQIEEQVHQLAFYDELTQLPNRRLLIDRLKQAMAACKRNGRYAALLFLDLDNFKPLNDRHGHKAGDLLLIEVARRLKTCVREIDTASRFGGDEFVVLLSDLVADKAESTAQAGTIAEKIRIKLAEPYLLPIKSGLDNDATVEHRCTASIGAVVFCNHETNHEDILKSADAAMYQAKQVGRNLVRFHDL